MLEPLDSYWTRFWGRFLKDSTPWARDNIVWGVVVLIAPALAIYIRDPHASIDWILIRNTLLLYTFAFVVYALSHLIRTPRKLDLERDTREIALLGDITARDRSIQGRDETILTLSQEPKRTPGEQHAYDTVKSALDLTKDIGLTALRHLRNHGTLTFGTYDPELPPGLKRDQILWVYNHCLSLGIVTRTANLGHSEFIYSLSPNPAMGKALDDLLFPENGLSGLTNVRRK